MDIPNLDYAIIIILLIIIFLTAFTKYNIKQIFIIVIMSISIIIQFMFLERMGNFTENNFVVKNLDYILIVIIMIITFLVIFSILNIDFNINNNINLQDEDPNKVINIETFNTFNTFNFEDSYCDTLTDNPPELEKECNKYDKLACNSCSCCSYAYFSDNSEKCVAANKSNADPYKPIYLEDDKKKIISYEYKGKKINC